MNPGKYFWPAAIDISRLWRGLMFFPADKWIRQIAIRSFLSSFQLPIILTHALYYRTQILHRRRRRVFLSVPFGKLLKKRGFLIAGKSGGSGSCIKLNQEKDISRFAAYRREISSGRTTLKEIARRESLSFPLNALMPYAHWITPEIQPKRFSTRFFLAKLPDGQKATTDSDELTDFLWVTSEDALQMHLNREIMLMPPTLKTIEELSAYSCMDALFAVAQSRTIYPILPQPMNGVLKLPHDPEYSIERYRKPARTCRAFPFYIRRRHLENRIL